MAINPIKHSPVEAAGRKFLRWVFKGRLITRSLPADLGSARIRVAPESMLKYLRPGDAGLDPMLLRLAREFVKPGDLVWDIGANVGVFTFAAASRGATVLAAEPDPVMAKALLDGRSLNPSLKVNLLTAAISDEIGLAELSISSGGRASNALSAFAGDRPAFGVTLETMIVPTVTLDSLLARGTPAFVKIDVEGAELAVLQSAGKVLKEARPIMQVEVADGRLQEVTDLLKAANYKLYATGANWMKPIDLAVENTICIPAEKAS